MLIILRRDQTYQSTTRTGPDARTPQPAFRQIDGLIQRSAAIVWEAVLEVVRREPLEDLLLNALFALFYEQETLE